MGKAIEAPLQSIELKVKYESRSSVRGEICTDELYKSFNREKAKDIFNPPSRMNDSATSNFSPSLEHQDLVVDKQKTLRDFRFDPLNFKVDDIEYEDILHGNLIINDEDQEDENLL